MSQTVKGSIKETLYTLPNFLNGSQPEVLCVTTYNRSNPLECNMSSARTDEICAALDEMEAQLGLMSLPANSGIWRDYDLKEVYDDGVGQCLGEIEDTRLLSMKLFVDGDSKQPISEAKSLKRLASGRRRRAEIMLDHPVFNQRDFPTDEMGTAVAFLVNPEAWNPVSGEIDIRSLINVRVRFKDGFQELMNFNDLVSPRF